MRKVDVTIKNVGTYDVPEQRTDAWWALIEEVKKHPRAVNWTPISRDELDALARSAKTEEEGLHVLDLINEFDMEIVAYLSGTYDNDNLFVEDYSWKDE